MRCLAASIGRFQWLAVGPPRHGRPKWKESEKKKKKKKKKPSRMERAEEHGSLSSSLCVTCSVFEPPCLATTASKHSSAEQARHSESVETQSDWTADAGNWGEDSGAFKGPC